MGWDGTGRGRKGHAGNWRVGVGLSLKTKSTERRHAGAESANSAVLIQQTGKSGVTASRRPNHQPTAVCTTVYKQTITKDTGNNRTPTNMVQSHIAAQQDMHVHSKKKTQKLDRGHERTGFGQRYVSTMIYTGGQKRPGTP